MCVCVLERECAFLSLLARSKRNCMVEITDVTFLGPPQKLRTTHAQRHAHRREMKRNTNLFFFKTKRGGVLAGVVLVCSPALRARCLPGSGSRSPCPSSTGRCPAPGSLGLWEQPGKDDIQHVKVILSSLEQEAHTVPLSVPACLS